MTPFEVSLDSDLKTEGRHFANKWLFEWYKLGWEERAVVDVDSFDGERIHVGGVTFSGSTQLVFWQAIGRYLEIQVHQAFRRWDSETGDYGKKERLKSLVGTESLLYGFVARTIQKAVETDRRLRGKGYPNSVQPYNASQYQTAAIAEIVRLKKAHEGLLRAEAPVLAKASRVAWISNGIEQFYANHKGLIWLGGVMVSLLGALYKFGAG